MAARSTVRHDERGRRAVVSSGRWVFVVSDDPRDADWVWAALDRFGPVARASGLTPPAIVSADVMHVLSVRSALELSKVQTLPGSAHDPDRDTLLLSFAGAARRVPTSPSTIRRLVDKKLLATVSIGRRRYIHPGDLQRYVDGLAKGAI